METWYEVRTYNSKVTPVEVEKSTDSSVWVRYFSGKFHRRAIASTYENFFPSFNEAKAFLIERETSRLESAKQNVSTCERNLAAALELEEPK